MRYTFATIGAGLWAVAAAWVVLLGYADWLYTKNQPEAVAAARRLVPGKAEYFSRSVEVEQAGAALRAVELNPYISKEWITLALEAELSGNLDRAEQLLLEAYRRDRTYVPRWSLANFYFRTGNRERFWDWARRAAEMAPHDQSALFELCWRISENGAEIQRRAIPAIPGIQAQYLHFLLRTGRIEAARTAAEELARHGSAGERDAVLAACDQLLSAGRVEDALGLWNLLSSRGLIPYPALSPRDNPMIVNGDFQQAPIPGGFDWRIWRPPGVAVRGPAQTLGFSLQFSGSQPPSCELAAQVVLAEGGRTYRLRYLYRTRGVPPGSGLAWRVGGLTGASVWHNRSKDLSSEEWKEEEFDFAIPPGEHGAKLALTYQRAPGTTRIQGSLELRRVRLEPGVGSGERGERQKWREAAYGPPAN